MNSHNLESRSRTISVLDELEATQRDVTALRSELGSIALLMQERGRLPHTGGPNYALVAGAVTEYVIAMELAVVALNEDRKDMLADNLRHADPYLHGGINVLNSLLEGLDSAPAAVWCEQGVRETIINLIGHLEDMVPRDETGRPL